ncbi:MAG TPA: HDOD domain-containing protein [bacterium]|nr:HDOD domain-containing protein [bacterium]
MDREVAQKVVDRLKDVPTLPSVIQKIIEIVDSPHTSASDLNKAISLDQALSAKVLKLVNSAFYGFPKKIETLTQAIVILGFNTVRSLALSISMIDFFTRRRGKKRLDYNEYWRHSIATSIMARAIAKKVFPQMAEEAFVSGLLHDIGILILDQFIPDEFQKAYEKMKTDRIHLYDAEKQELGITHCDVGRMLAIKWNLPDPLLYTINYHHHPDPTKDYFPIVSTVHAANIGVKILGLGGIGDEDLYRTIHIDEEAKRVLKLDEDFPQSYSEIMESGMREGEDFLKAING